MKYPSLSLPKSMRTFVDSAWLATKTNFLAGNGSGCFEWAGHRTLDGYGGSGARKAHRVSHEAHLGPIPEGHHVHHVCGNRACVNPMHLEALSPFDHLRTAKLATQEAKPLMGWGKHHAAKQACPKGHPYNEENTYFNPNGWRVCRECRRESIRNHRAKLRAERLGKGR